MWTSLKISLKFISKAQTNIFPALVQIMAWCRSGDKSLSETMIASLLTHICVTRPQWVNVVNAEKSEIASGILNLQSIPQWDLLSRWPLPVLFFWCFIASYFRLVTHHLLTSCIEFMTMWGYYDCPGGCCPANYHHVAWTISNHWCWHTYPTTIGR